MQPVKMAAGKSAERKKSMPTEDSRGTVKKKKAPPAALRVCDDEADNQFAGGFTRAE